MLQQPSQGGAAQAGALTVGGTAAAGQQGQQPRLVLGSLPGKLVLQGSQLAALAQAKAGQTGAQPKVLTIQLQVQQQPNQQGAKVSKRTGHMCECGGRVWEKQNMFFVCLTVPVGFWGS